MRSLKREVLLILPILCFGSIFISIFGLWQLQLSENEKLANALLKMPSLDISAVPFITFVKADNFFQLFPIFLEENKVIIFLILIAHTFLFMMLYLFLKKSVFNQLESIHSKRKKKMTILNEFEEINQKVITLEQQYDFKLHESEQFQKFAAHELRNELFILRNTTFTDKKAYKMSVLHLQDIVEDLLVLSKSMDSLPQEFVFFDQLLSQVIKRFPDIEFDLQLEESVKPIMIQSMDTWLDRCLYNVFLNATQHTTDNIVRISTEVLSSTLLIHVGNSAKMTNTNYNFLKDSVSERKDGNGIGLYLVHHVAQLLNGAIYYEQSDNYFDVYLSFPIVESKEVGINA